MARSVSNQRFSKGRADSGSATTYHGADSHSASRWFFQKNKKLLEHRVNKTFEEILWMNDQEFRNWVIELRKAVANIWDTDGSPPTVGLDENEIIEQFEKIESFKCAHFLQEQSGKRKQKVIVNTSKLGIAANQWFPTMMKTKINLTSDVRAGLSIYEHFKEKHLLERTTTYARRNFKRDSFYHYSHVVEREAKDHAKYIFSCKTGREWILKFEKDSKRLRKKYDYWIAPVKDEEEKYTGFIEEARSRTFLFLTKTDLTELPIPPRCKGELKDFPNSNRFKIRVFEKGQRLFPIGLKAFRISLCQYAVNFPPMTAKFLYERYLDKLGVKKAIIWDPSSGWGGRILGAMGLHRDYSVHYIGTDPNTDHNTTKGRTKYHELADFYNQVRLGTRQSGKKRRRLPKNINTYEIFQCGSEEMHKQSKFKPYRGKIDIVFTSPPYFGKELYSDDPEQSAIKFDAYTAWREGFLRKTLETAVEWLKPGGFILWNIANVKMGNKRLRLENDSCKILSSLGMKRIEVLKMGLAQMPGANRIDHTAPMIDVEEYSDADGSKSITKKRGKIIAPHGCYVEGKNADVPLKYEPIFVYQKPLSGAKNSHRSIQSNDSDPNDIAIKIVRLAKDFDLALKSPKVNPLWLRSIYQALNRVSKPENLAAIVRAFNKHKRNDFYLAQRELATPDHIAPQFAQRSVSNTPTKRIAGRKVLVQFVHNGKGDALEYKFSYGVVLESTPGDNPQTAWVKISSESNRAEQQRGLTIEVAKSDILKVSSDDAEFTYKNNKWIYSDFEA